MTDNREKIITDIDCLEGTFFGTHEGLDMDGYTKVTLFEGQALILPAKMIHAVETFGMSFTLGVNFIHSMHVKKAAEEFSGERYRHDPYDECYPHFPRLLFTHIASLMRYIFILNNYNIITLHDACNFVYSLFEIKMNRSFS